MIENTYIRYIFTHMIRLYLVNSCKDSYSTTIIRLDCSYEKYIQSENIPWIYANQRTKDFHI